MIMYAHDKGLPAVYAVEARTDDSSPEALGAGGELLDAVIAMASNLELPAVLDMIVNSARRLTGASYAALGVLEEDPALAWHDFRLDRPASL